MVRKTYTEYGWRFEDGETIWRGRGYTLEDTKYAPPHVQVVCRDVTTEISDTYIVRGFIDVK